MRRAGERMGERAGGGTTKVRERQKEKVKMELLPPIRRNPERGILAADGDYSVPILLTQIS